MTKTDADIAALSANVKNIADRIDRYQGYMDNYIQRGDIFREDASKTLAVIVENQKDMKIYTKQCDADRIIHDRRLTSCEGFQSRLLRIASILSIFLASSITGIIEWLKH